ncbi:MAG: thioredoxin fold domain-containing protein, partial [Planctomycetota bacterium]|jgi:thioredoxin-related protein
MVSALAPLLLSLALQDPSTTVPEAEITWLSSNFQESLELAQEKERFLVLYFHADWSDWSNKFEKEAFADPKVLETFSSSLMLKLIHGTTAGDDLLKRYKVQTFPTIVFVRPDGFADDQIGGYIPAMEFATEAQRILDGVQTRSALEVTCKENPEDLQACYDLAQKCWALGDDDAYWVHMETIKQKDPEGRSEVRRRMEMYAMMEYIFGCAQDDIAKVDLQPLEDFLVDPEYPVYPSILHEGYEYIAGIRKDLGENEKALEAHRMAWVHVPAVKMVSYSYGLVQDFIDLEEYATEQDREFAVEVAEALVKEVEQYEDCNTDSLCLERLAECYEIAGRRSEAIAALERAIETGGGDTDALRARVATWKPSQ